MYIVHSLACYDSPSTVANSVSEEFGINIERGQIQKYDPTKAAGQGMAKKLKDIFEETRKAFLEETSQIPIASKSFRLRSLQRMHDYYVTRKNFVQAQAILEQAAREVGGYYSRATAAPDAINPFADWLKGLGNNAIPISQDIPDDDDAIDGQFHEVTVEKAEAPAAVKPPKISWKKSDGGS